MDITFLVVALIYFLRFLSWIIIARIIISWVAPHARHPIVVFIVQTSEQVIAPIRKALPRGSGQMAMIDWSPLVALILIDTIRYLILRALV